MFFSLSFIDSLHPQKSVLFLEQTTGFKLLFIVIVPLVTDLCQLKALESPTLRETRHSLHGPGASSRETLALTGSADSQGRVPLMVALALALGAALQGIPICTLHSYNSSILIHLPGFQPLLDSIHILSEVTVHLCN